ncbi:MAG: hypothetical protein ACRDTE_02605 [Pseudonocardiaceae bacterium]
MALFNNDADQRLRDACRALDDNTDREHHAGITDETEEFNNLNDAVHHAEQDASWWTRHNR